jgi:hypothetical protein
MECSWIAGGQLDLNNWQKIAFPAYFLLFEAFNRNPARGVHAEPATGTQKIMSLFGNILTKIFHHDSAKAAPAPAAPTPAAGAAPAQPAPAPAASPAAAPEQPANVDVGAVLSAMAEMKPDHGGNYQSSIVDLLKLLDLDSSLSARKELADELAVHAGDNGSAEQNIALHRAVMDKLAANGGIVPDSLRN